MSRSISEERTFSRDLRDRDRIEAEILDRSEGVARALRREGLLARTIHLKLRTGEFVTFTRALTLAAPTCLTETIYDAARELFATRIRLGGRGVRLLGVGAANLLPHDAGQRDLFPDPALDRSARAARASDALVERFGESAVTRARLLKTPAPLTSAARRSKFRAR